MALKKVIWFIISCAALLGLLHGIVLLLDYYDLYSNMLYGVMYFTVFILIYSGLIAIIYLIYLLVKQFISRRH